MGNQGQVLAPEADKPSIFYYHDYRKFLKDTLEFLDSEHGGHSVRAVSIKAGFNESYLPLVLRGHRNLTDEATEKLFKIVKLKPAEKSFFKLLCQLADSSRSEERLEAISKMQRFPSYQEVNGSNIESYRYLSKWYYVVIREMAELPDFKMDAKWIQSKLKWRVPIKEIEKAIDFLTEHKFIEFHPSGKVKTPDKNIDASGGLFKVALNNFHEQMFDLAIRAADVTPREDRLIDAHTFPVSNKDIEEIRKILSDAIDKVVDYMDKTPNKKKDVVYHVAFAGFPTSKDGAKNG